MHYTNVSDSCHGQAENEAKSVFPDSDELCGNSKVPKYSFYDVPFRFHHNFGKPEVSFDINYPRT